MSAAPPPPPAPSSARARRLRVFRAAAAAASFLLALAAAEVILRIAGFSFPLYPKKIEFGYPNPQELNDYYAADPRLFWVRKDYYKRLEQAAGAVDIAFLGCSCTDFGDFDRRLAEEISARRPGKSAATINLATAGWTSFQGLRQMERDVPKLRPKLAFIYFGWNDHWMGFGIEDKKIDAINRSPLYALRELRLAQLAGRAWIGLRGGAGAELKRVSPEDFEANLRGMVRAARASGTEPILLTAPSGHAEGRVPAFLTTRWTSDLASVIPVHRQYAELVRKVAREESARLCDLAAAFEREPAAKVRGEYLTPDGIHLRPEGSRAIARILADCLEEYALLDSVARPAAEARSFYGAPWPGLKLPAKRPDPVDANDAPQIEILGASVSANGIGKIRGWFVAPREVEDVVCFLDGANVGAAQFPVEPEPGAALPPRARPFLLQTRARAKDSKAAQLKVQLFSGETVFFEREFAAEFKPESD